MQIIGTPQIIYIYTTHLLLKTSVTEFLHVDV